MTFEEQAAYALASWRRLESEFTDELLLAITTAFVLVAVADGDASDAEIDRFLELLRECADVLAPLDIDRVEPLFRDLTGALLTDPEGGRGHALADIAAVKGDPNACELVRSAAEIALAADRRTLAREQEVLSQICVALGIRPR